MSNFGMVEIKIGILECLIVKVLLLNNSSGVIFKVIIVFTAGIPAMNKTGRVSSENH